jgi:hypothetical protein
MTLGNAAKAELLLIILCPSCGHQVEPVRAEMALVTSGSPHRTIYRGGGSATQSLSGEAIPVFLVCAENRALERDPVVWLTLPQNEGGMMANLVKELSSRESGHGPCQRVHPR